MQKREIQVMIKLSKTKIKGGKEINEYSRNKTVNCKWRKDRC